MRFIPIALGVLAVLAPGLLQAQQDREPSSRQVIVDLAYVLGEAHALRQACQPNDQHWRNRMLAMVDNEDADHNFTERLRQTFNTGYVARQTEFPSCSRDSRRAEAEVAAHGARLARRMAQ